MTVIGRGLDAPCSDNSTRGLAPSTQSFIPASTYARFEVYKTHVWISALLLGWLRRQCVRHPWGTHRVELRLVQALQLLLELGPEPPTDRVQRFVVLRREEIARTAAAHPPRRLLKLHGEQPAAPQEPAGTSKHLPPQHSGAGCG